MNPAELYKDDPTIRQGPDGNWYHYPDHFPHKLAFLICSLLIVALGAWLIWDPAVRALFGERAQVRITEIVRQEPGREPDRIRFRQEIPEGSHLTKFHYNVVHEQEDGSREEMFLAVGSRRNAYANVNDELAVIFFPDEEHAYALFHHRTWSFGVGFLFVGVVLTACAIPTLRAVGKPILIDPEAAQPTEEEQEAA